MKMAKASADDLRRVREFFEMLEEVIERRTYTTDEDTGEPQIIDDERLLALIRQMWSERGLGVVSSWFRVVYGCQVLIDNCCDPDADTLEFRPDIAKAMEAAGVK